MPVGWSAVETKLNNSPSAEVRARVQSLSLVFGSANALAALRKTLSDASADAGARRKPRSIRCSPRMIPDLRRCSNRSWTILASRGPRSAVSPPTTTPIRPPPSSRFIRAWMPATVATR